MHEYYRSIFVVSPLKGSKKMMLNGSYFIRIDFTLTKHIKI